ncbi:hypothetical protein DM01DRAFT_1331094 [Hesseltinella vesiculosa]|uniref:Tetraspanin Tsp2 n=1 Tax=Hesseltinella vesiculosa TaxID=101127 RepID=A0A1X2GY36_9FUNG|nr:hypothetical protein DM01DRAFT_1331094 [Hesseltinella vesiculosa]
MEKRQPTPDNKRLSSGTLLESAEGLPGHDSRRNTYASSLQQQQLRDDQLWDSTDDLPEPVLPWMRSESRNSLGGTSQLSVDAASLHAVKRYIPEQINTKRQRWTLHKWWLLFSNTLLFCIGLGAMMIGILTYCKFYLRAEVVIVGESVLLNLILSTGVVCLATSLLGYVGIMLNNRTILAVYNLFLWVCFGLIAAIGYYSYRRNKWNISGKLSQQWHRFLSPAGRAAIQANLHCCGYKAFSDYHENSDKCFPRTLLPGCHYKYQQFIVGLLTISYIVAFACVPLIIFILISGLLCANHINRKFGKNLPPKIYRLDYRGIVAGTPTGSSLNVATQGLHRRG